MASRRRCGAPSSRPWASGYWRPPDRSGGQKCWAATGFVGNRTNGSALQDETGGLAMPSAAYFRRQADICLRLSLISSDDEVSSRLIAMARDYLAIGEALERETEGLADPAAALAMTSESPGSTPKS